MKHTAERLKGPIFGNVNPLFLYRSKMFKWDILMFSSVWILKYFYTNILFFFHALSFYKCITAELHPVSIWSGNHPISRRTCQPIRAQYCKKTQSLNSCQKSYKKTLLLFIVHIMSFNIFPQLIFWLIKSD